MRSREAAVRSKRFEASEKAQKVRDLEQMIREFEQMASDLERQVQAEEDRTGVKDRTHFAYSTFAKAASQRRENLLASIGGLRVKLDAAVRERDDAEAEVAASAPAELREVDTARRRIERSGLSSLR